MDMVSADLNTEDMNTALQSYLHSCTATRPQVLRQLVRALHSNNSLVLVDHVLDSLLGIDSERLEQTVNFSELEKNYGSEQYDYQDTIYDFIRCFIQRLNLKETDVLYDLGAGYGRVIIYAGLTTEACCKGIEVVPQRADAANATKENLGLENVEIIKENVLDMSLKDGTAFFLFNPFTPNTLHQVGNKLNDVALSKQIRIASVGVCTEYFRKQRWLYEVSAYSAPPYWTGAIFDSKAHLLVNH